MTLDEKSGRSDHLTKWTDTVVSNASSFSDVVNEACEKLMDRQIKYSIRRIQEMDEHLTCLEKELDEFLLRGKLRCMMQKNRKL